MVRCCARFPAWSRVKCADQRRLGDATLPGGGRKMGVPVGSIAVGKCYITEIGQVRRVLEVKDGRVKYESRGKTAHGGTWGAWTTVGDGKFAREVERGWTGGIIGDEGTWGLSPYIPLTATYPYKRTVTARYKIPRKQGSASLHVLSSPCRPGMTWILQVCPAFSRVQIFANLAISHIYRTELVSATMRLASRHCSVSKHTA